jgi:dTDP-4-amino-4,6-dideoxygalactose transaminase
VTGSGTPGRAVPQASPLAQYEAHRAAIDDAVARVLRSGHYILGPEVEAFEREWARFVGVEHAIGVGSGTAALELALRAAGIGRGDEVVTTPHTAIATVAAIESVGAVPVLADVRPDTMLLDAAAVARVVGPRTRAVVPVHLFGQPADLDDLLALARERGLKLIEDCAQAHGARYRGRRVGAWGDLGCFSFYPTKNLGAIGDGGMIVTSDAEVAANVRSLREYGWRQRYVSDVAGTNSRLDELQAAILRAKLPFLDEDNRRRAALAAAYTRALAGVVGTPTVGPHRESAWHLYVVRTPRRDALRKHLAEAGIGTAVHYPVPAHLQPAYRGRLGDTGSFPEAERAAGDVLSLPLYPELPAGDVDRVAAAIGACFAGGEPARSA